MESLIKIMIKKLYFFENRKLLYQWESVKVHCCISKLHIYIYIYIYICVCVCVCVILNNNLLTPNFWNVVLCFVFGKFSLAQTLWTKPALHLFLSQHVSMKCSPLHKTRMLWWLRDHAVSGHYNMRQHEATVSPISCCFSRLFFSYTLSLCLGPHP